MTDPQLVIMGTVVLGVPAAKLVYDLVDSEVRTWRNPRGRQLLARVRTAAGRFVAGSGVVGLGAGVLSLLAWIGGAKFLAFILICVSFAGVMLVLAAYATVTESRLSERTARNIADLLRWIF